MQITHDNTLDTNSLLHRAAMQLYPAGVLSLCVLLIAGLFI